jgi:L,D-peptidoglycan transpeptidase YkuD (ErfK/YbiS/YcfS/YnhG family)
MTTNHDKLNNSNDQVAKLEIISGSHAILHFTGRHLPAAIGRNGVRTDKQEGDGATPSGLLPLRRILYRSDRLDAPKTSLLCEPLIRIDGWCDDATHPDYNRQIQLPHPASHERLWLENGLYDIIGILGYNDDPIIPGRGSAIFLHVASPDMTPTDGCIALSLDDLCWALEQGLDAIFVPN